MIIKVPSVVTVKWGRDKFNFKAFQVRIKWDENSFQIEGLFKPDVINIGESDGRDSKDTERNK